MALLWFSPRFAFQGYTKVCIKIRRVWNAILFEIVPMTSSPSEKSEFIIDTDVLTKACLMAVSLGADIIKTNYSNEPKTFKKVTSACPVSVTILSGEHVSDEECLKRIRGAMDGGASGGAFR